ncbi:ATP-binding protein, partial [Streptomyces sp. B1866]|uniref:ATP-binding protein n=1 Tax=Streptomyces sp. B1866 TaxID=3075431 RepID=UPI00288E4649
TLATALADGSAALADGQPAARADRQPHAQPDVRADTQPHGKPDEQAGDEAAERLCDMLTGTLLPSDRPAPDDTALLIARTHATPAESVAFWPLPEDPVACGQARTYIREQLAVWDLTELETTTELIVSELVGNVVRHARGPVALRLLRSRTLICEVSDGSLTTPHIRHPSATDEGGRGLQLIAAMAVRWGTRYTGTGKCIWTEQRIPEGPGEGGEEGPEADLDLWSEEGADHDLWS